MVTSIVILVGLAIASFFLFVVLCIVGVAMLKGGKKAPVKAKPEHVPSWLQPQPSQSPVLSYREQINAEKADAVMKLYADLTEKKFVEETIADARKMFAEASPAE